MFLIILPLLIPDGGLKKGEGKGNGKNSGIGIGGEFMRVWLAGLYKE